MELHALCLFHTLIQNQTKLLSVRPDIIIISLNTLLGEQAAVGNVSKEEPAAAGWRWCPLHTWPPLQVTADTEQYLHDDFQNVRSNLTLSIEDYSAVFRIHSLTRRNLLDFQFGRVVFSVMVFIFIWVTKVRKMVTFCRFRWWVLLLLLPELGQSGRLWQLIPLFTPVRLFYTV